MAVAILGGVFIVLVTGLVLAISTAVQARHQVKDLQRELAAARGIPLDPEFEPVPWSSLDLAALRDDVTAIDRNDPFATLTGADSPVSWRDAVGSNTPDPTPDSPPGMDLEAGAELAPVETGGQAHGGPAAMRRSSSWSSAPNSSQPTRRRASRRPRDGRGRAQVDDSFAMTFDANGEPVKEPSYDPGVTRDGVAVVGGPIGPRSRRRSGDPFQQPPEKDDRHISWCPPARRARD
jgi:hypothetical protein